MSRNRKKTSLTQMNKNQREIIKGLRKEIEELQTDRQKFRDYFSHKLKWFVELHGKGTSPSTAFLIEDMSKLFNRVERWWW